MRVTGNFTKIPNRFFDLMPKMKGSVSQVVIAYLRASSGWDKDHTFMSLTDFENATGLKRSTVQYAIKQAINDGYIAVDNKRKGKHGKKCYTAGANLIDSTIPNIDIDSANCTQIEYSMTVQDEDEIVPKIGIDDNKTIPKIGTISDEIVPKIGTHINKELLKEKNIKEKELPVTSTDLSNFVDGDCESVTDEMENKPMSDTITTLDDFFLDDASPEEEYVDPDLVTDFTNTPFTQDEYDWFVGGGRCSLRLLALSVYCPITYTIGQGKDEIIGNPCWYDRSFFEMYEPKKLTDWQKIVGIVNKYFNFGSNKQATVIAQQLAGKAKKGEWLEWNIEPGMDAVEACAFGLWLSEMKAREKKFRPQKPEKIHLYVEEFRSLPNHFEHINYARYMITQLFPKPQETIEIDDTPVDPAELEKFYAEQEAILGFPLSGSYG